MRIMTFVSKCESTPTGRLKRLHLRLATCLRKLDRPRHYVRLLCAGVADGILARRRKAKDCDN